MATWAKDNVGGTGYYNISSIWRAYTAQWVQDPTYQPTADNKWYIWIDNGIQSSVRIDGPYADKPTADSALTTAINGLGGFV